MEGKKQGFGRGLCGYPTRREQVFSPGWLGESRRIAAAMAMAVEDVHARDRVVVHELAVAVTVAEGTIARRREEIGLAEEVEGLEEVVAAVAGVVLEVLAVAGGLLPRWPSSTTPCSASAICKAHARGS